MKFANGLRIELVIGTYTHIFWRVVLMVVLRVDSYMENLPWGGIFRGGGEYFRGNYTLRGFDRTTI